MLEARLIEVDKTAKHEMESILTAVYRGWLFSSTQAGGEANDGGYDRIKLPTIISPALKILDAGLSSMESEKKDKILASPSIVALDRHKAIIKLSHNYLYQSNVDKSGNVKLASQETGPSLEITPLVGRDGFITLRLRISSGEIVGFRKSGTSEAPETSQCEVETCVRVRDGEPFVIGGLYAESRSKNVSKAPLLGYIPLIGELFTSRSDVRINSELAFIVVPHVLEIPSSRYADGDALESGAGLVGALHD